MRTASPRTPARYFALLCDLLKADGIDVDAMLRRARIWPTQIYGPDATITARQFEALVEEATLTSGRGDLGFALGRQIKLSSHEILGYGIITSPTLDYAMQLAARYYRLINTAFKLQHRRDARHSELHFQPALQLNPVALRFLLETIVVSTHEQLKSLMQDRLPSYDIYVSYEEPKHIRYYRELKPARFHFGSERLLSARLVLDAEVVSRTLPMADRSALKMAESRCEELLRTTSETSSMTEWVGMMLREANEGMPTLAELAHLLNQSPRTLDRRLGREGTRFLDLSNGIRHEKAGEMLKSAQMSVTQIAYQLGYRDLANFSRAFKKWTGESPREFQARMAAR